MEAPPLSVQSTSSSPVPENPPETSQISQTPAASPVKSENPDRESIELLPFAASCPADRSPPASYTITIPSCSGWFSWDEVHDTERRILPEFFDGRRPSKNPSVYKHYRDSIVRRFRANPSRKLTFTEARRGLVGDVGSVRRVFDFLELWGLINYTPSSRTTPKEKTESGDLAERKDISKKLCSNCRSPCENVCFVTDKADIVLCTRCFVRGNYRAGLNSADFKRVDSSEETKTEWTDKETLHLLEAILHYGEDWKKVAEHVGSRGEKECVARFIKLPVGEQLLGSPEFKENDHVDTEPSGYNIPELNFSKRRRLTPLADASNPIMAQVCLSSACSGVLSPSAAASLYHKAVRDVGFKRSSTDFSLFTHHQLTETVILLVAIHIAKNPVFHERTKLIEKYIQGIEGCVSATRLQRKNCHSVRDRFLQLDLLLDKVTINLNQLSSLVTVRVLKSLLHIVRKRNRGKSKNKFEQRRREPM
ncbi:SWI/SNF complex subunit SWI3B [Platanthera zijinensis]|uniref:SWI/SNF complex subunit SWI3B n=1 Tax=Platanthera zijinensis TaxID=2320716 RepID=A0AAP0BRA1_9ASPA